MADEQSFLIPQDDYLKSGIHIGTKFKNEYMAPFIYKMRPDGLSVLNLQVIDERLRHLITLFLRTNQEIFFLCLVGRTVGKR